VTRIDIDGPVTIVPVHEPQPPQPADDTVWWCLLGLMIVIVALTLGR